MNILLIGYNGKLGKRLSKILENKANIINFKGDATDLNQLQNSIKEIDVIVSTIGTDSVEKFIIVANNIIKLAKENDIRIVWSGGAASLIQNNGARLVDIKLEEFDSNYKLWIPAIYGHYEVLKLFIKNKEVKWSYMSPALEFVDKDIEGQLITKQTDNALYNSFNKSFASYQAGAIALANEILNPKYLNNRFTIVEQF